MNNSSSDASKDLATIRHLMERARTYRYLPYQAPLVAGTGALIASSITHYQVTLQNQPPEKLLAILWILALLMGLGTQLVMNWNHSRKQNIPIWTPLTLDIVSTLWPAFLSGWIITLLCYKNFPEIIPSVWMLLYGAAAISAGAYARNAVRNLGISFIFTALIDALLHFPPGIILGISFAGFHLIYSIVLYRKP